MGLPCRPLQLPCARTHAESSARAAVGDRGHCEHRTLPAASEGTGGGTVGTDIGAVGTTRLQPQGTSEDKASRAAAFDVKQLQKRQSRQEPRAGTRKEPVGGGGRMVAHQRHCLGAPQTLRRIR